MRKLLSVTAALLVTSMLLFTGAFAVTDEEYSLMYQEQLSKIGADGLSKLTDAETEQLLEQLGISDMNPTDMMELAPESMLEIVSALTKRSYPEPLAACFVILAVTLVSYVLNGMSVNKSGFTSATRYFSAVTSCASVVGVIAPQIERVADRIGEAAVVMTGFVPVFGASVASGGQPASAAVSSAAMLTVAELSVWISQIAIVPLCSVMLAFGVTGAVSDTIGFDMLPKLINRAVCFLLGIAAAAFTWILILKSGISGAADSLTVRSLKMAVSGGVPVIGGSLSEAVSSVVSCLSLVRNSVGFFGMAALLLCFLPQLVSLLLWRAAFAVCKFAAEAAGVTAVKKITSSAGDAVTVMTAVTFFVPICFCAAVAVILRTGGIA